jgi:hypothetical protein
MPNVMTVPPAPVDTTTAAASGSGADSATQSSSGPGHPMCASTDLVLSFGPSNSALGYRYQALDFTNTSHRTCVLSGFPGVSYAVDNGRQIGALAARDGTAGEPVTLKHGQVASSILAIADAGMFPTDLCQPTAVDGLRVYPPNSTAALYIANPGIACGTNPPSPQLRVRAVTAGVGSP